MKENFHFYFLTDYTTGLDHFSDGAKSTFQELETYLPDLKDSVKTFLPDEAAVQQAAANNDKYLLDREGKWSAQAANDYMNTILASHNAAGNNMIELVICNNDSMAEGAISDKPVQTQFGWHLVMVTKKIPAVAAKDEKPAEPEKVRASHILVKAEAPRPLPDLEDVEKGIRERDENQQVGDFLKGIISGSGIKAADEYKQMLP